jgi:hypothetical protein
VSILGIKRRFLGRPVHTLFTTPIKLSRLPFEILVEDKNNYMHIIRIWKNFFVTVNNAAVTLYVLVWRETRYMYSALKSIL